MVERKKPGVTFESFVDKQIREAQENGEFENLAGTGKPIPASAQDALWWIKGYLRRENLSTDALLPESLQLRKEIEKLSVTLSEMRLESSVRTMLTDLNTRVVEWIRMPTPPLVPISPVDVDEWVDRWRRDRRAADVGRAPVRGAATEPPSARTTWWTRLLRRRVG